MLENSEQFLENSEQLEVPEQLTDNQKKLLKIYEDFKKFSFDEKKVKELILDLKTTDPNLETQLSEEMIDDYHLKFYDFGTSVNYTISGLALIAGISSKENKTLDCLKFLSNQNLVTRDHLAIILDITKENFSVLGAVIAPIVLNCEGVLDKDKAREIITYYLEPKSQIEKAEAIVGYYSDPSRKEITLSNYLVSNIGTLIEDRPFLIRFGLQFSDIFDEKVKAEIYENFYLTPLGVFLNSDNPELQCAEFILNEGANPDSAATIYDLMSLGALVTSDKPKLEFMEFILNKGANPNSAAQVNNDGSTVAIFDFALAIARDSGFFGILKILIQHCADYGNLDEDINCPEEIKAEINKNKNTKKFFDGDISVDLKDINERFLKKLCKESGIPSHLLSETEEINADYRKIKEEFKKLASDSEKTLSSLLAEILHAGNQLDFPSSASHDLLDLKDFSAKNKEIYETTKESYKQNPHLTSAQFLNKDELDKKSLILFRDQKASNRFFEQTNQLILPKEQLETLNKLKEMYFSAPSHVVEVFSAQAQELMDVKQKLSEKQKLMDLLKSETAEQKEARLTQEDLKKAADGNVKKITDFFKKPEDTQAPSSLPLLAETSIEPEDTQAPSSLPTKREGGGASSSDSKKQLTSEAHRGN